MNILPITLVGNNLAEKHQHLNCLVQQAYDKRIPLDSVVSIPEYSPVDRLFKIELALKYKSVKYLLENMKDPDMLFVSRAMTCEWLVADIRYADIIKPSYLEQNLFPYMLTTAVNKMNHWIALNLKDPSRCQDFYEHHKIKDQKYALKFLPKCSNEFIHCQIESIMIHMTPKYLKILSEKTPRAAKLFFDHLPQCETLVKSCYRTGNKYLKNIHHLLKTDPEIYFEIIESFYHESFGRLSKDATNHIMIHHRDKFEAKPELYAGWFLQIPTLSRFLDSDTSKDLLSKLSHAEGYLEGFNFCYETVESIVKKINPEEKQALCKVVFANDRERTRTSQYPLPQLPTRQWDNRNCSSGSLDYDNMLIERKMRKMCGRLSGAHKMFFKSSLNDPSLSKLFDQYRFMNYWKTFKDVKSRLEREGAEAGRRNLLLVLASKSASGPDALSSFLEYLTGHHSAESAHTRASVIRSIARRAKPWRLPTESWQHLITFSHDLPPLEELIHAAAIRNLLSDASDDEYVNFLSHFSTLTEYPLNVREKAVVKQMLPEILLRSVAAADDATQRLIELLNTLDAYKIPYDQLNGVMEAVVSTGNSALLMRLYNARFWRKQLFHQNLELIQTDANAVNTLKYDARAASKLQWLEKNKCPNFWRKVTIYFPDLKETYINRLNEAIADKPRAILARPLAILSYSGDFIEQIKQRRIHGSKAEKKFASEMASNLAVARPRPQLLGIDIQTLGVVALAVLLPTASAANLQQWEIIGMTPRGARIALATRGVSAKRLQTAATLRPFRALRTALCTLRRTRSNEQWCSVIELLRSVDMKNKTVEVYHELARLNRVPMPARVQYALTLLQALDNIGFSQESGIPAIILSPLLTCISRHLDLADGSQVPTIINRFLTNHFTVAKVKNGYGSLFDWEAYQHCSSFTELIARFLLWSENETDLDIRFQSVGKPFLDTIITLYAEERKSLKTHLENFANKFIYLEVIVDRVSTCLLVVEKILNYCDKIFSIEKDFADHFRFRLVALVIRTTQRAVGKNPHMFTQRPFSDECKDYIGYELGKTMADDVELLVTKYFTSIRDIYRLCLENHLRYRFPINSPQFLPSTLKGLMEDRTKTNAVLVGVLFFNPLNIESDIISEDINEGEVKYFTGLNKLVRY